MNLQRQLVILVCTFAVFGACRSRTAGVSVQASDNTPSHDYQQRIHAFATRADGKFVGEFETGLFFFKQQLTVDVEIKRLDGTDNNSRLISMSIAVKDQFRCQANALISLDNDAYPIAGQNSATIEIAAPYRISAGKCPFIAVLAIPEGINKQQVQAKLALTVTNDLGSRQVYRGTLRRVNSENH
jgi:hypothetical protein